MDDRFDYHLCQSEHIATLFISLNDEAFSVREKAVVILCRLIPLNPSYILPAMRKNMIMLLAELEFSNVASQRKDSSSLLLHIVPHLGNVVWPYVDTIVESIPLGFFNIA